MQAGAPSAWTVVASVWDAASVSLIFEPLRRKLRVSPDAESVQATYFFSYKKHGVTWSMHPSPGSIRKINKKIKMTEVNNLRGLEGLHPFG